MRGKSNCWESRGLILGIDLSSVCDLMGLSALIYKIKLLDEYVVPHPG